MLVTFCSLLVTFWSLLIVFCSLLVTFYLLFVTFCSLLVAFCSLLVTFSLLLDKKFSLFCPNYCEIKLLWTAIEWFDYSKTPPQIFPCTFLRFLQLFLGGGFQSFLNIQNYFQSWHKVTNIAWIDITFYYNICNLLQKCFGKTLYSVHLQCKILCLHFYQNWSFRNTA